MRLDSIMVYLLLGSNLGKREAILNGAINKIAEQIGLVTKKSSFYETAAWGNPDQPSFINVALEVETFLSPLEVLDKALQIEAELGRVRQERWGARLIDIDVILYGDEVVDEQERLQVPHPEMQFRKFVLEPLAEIAPDNFHPLLKQTVSTLLSNLNDNLAVLKIV
jgi:2-amino-4-hydroxy-6-hydroxymethyldihydropteridine diphosphokinase